MKSDFDFTIVPTLWQLNYKFHSHFIKYLQNTRLELHFSGFSCYLIISDDL
jgi:hypothetical protein